MSAPQREFNPGAALLAWLWPGAGHIAIGEKRRGGLVMFGILFLILAGLLAGGVESVDRQGDWIWFFFAQSFCGPIVFGIDFITQTLIMSRPAEEQTRLIGIGRANEMGTLFVALAGLMNLVVIIDAMFYTPRQAQAFVPARRKEDAA